ncbi:MAG: hypothetical protein ABSE20_14825 [Acetobacteraceae bacterium]|jgi:hypothetical protein
MTMDLLKVPVTSVTEQSAAGGLPAPAPGPVIRPHDPRPLDWGHVVDAAAARLEESWVRPDNTGHMLASGLADELAATLCAYGMVAAEVDHMHDHGDALPAGGQTQPK